VKGLNGAIMLCMVHKLSLIVYAINAYTVYTFSYCVCSFIYREEIIGIVYLYNSNHDLKHEMP